ncbi:MAG TPA: M17 family peptidase N-terminal domain-containing protein [Coleofasciculaceae cyanobacterium]
MELRPTNTALLEWSGDGLAIGLFDDQIKLTGDFAALDTRFAATLQELITETEFKAKEGSSISTRVGGNGPVRKVIVVGLGKADAFKLDTLRRAAAVSARVARKQKCKTLAISLPLWNGDAALSA